MNDETNNSLVIKISKLLRLSKSCNEAEAQAAFQKAKSLADKYGLDLEVAAMVGREEKEPFEESEVMKYKRLPVIHKYIVHIMQDFFKVQVIYSGRWGETVMNFIGRRNDIAVAKEVYGQLLSVFDWLWKNYKRENGLANDSKASYMYGLKCGLSEKLKNEQKNTLDDYIKGLPESLDLSGDKLQLAIVAEKGELMNEVGKRYPHLGNRKTKYASINRLDIYQDGVKAGRNINANKYLGLEG